MGSLNKAQFIEKYGNDAWQEESKKRNAWYKKYYDRHIEEKREKHRQYYWDNRDQLLQKGKEKRATNKKQPRSLEEKRIANLEAQKRYRAAHKVELQKKNKENCRKYYNTFSGRSRNLVHKYTQSDIEENRGDCTLTPVWIVENIFTSSCVYCGDSDWKHLGCDRIDNTLPHTPENCVCSCGICNIDRQLTGLSVEDFKQYRKINPRKCDIKKAG